MRANENGRDGSALTCDPLHEVRSSDCARISCLVSSPFEWTNPGGLQFMRKSWLLCVLLGTLAWAQAAPPNTTPPQSPAPAANQMNEQPPTAEKDSAASVPATAAVLTIDGVCEPQAKAPAAAKATSAPKAATNCKTVITKAQFEQLANNLAPNITPQMKKQLASVLPRLMAMSNEAKKEGLENT